MHPRAGARRYRVLLCIGAALLTAITPTRAQPAATPWRQLTLAPDQQNEWVFFGAPWTQSPHDGNPAGILRPYIKELHYGADANDGQTCRNVDVHLAFNTAKAYSDFEAEFEFRFESATAGASLIFGARSATDYFMAHIPTHGQTYRAKNFWAAFSRMQPTGYLKILKLQLMHGVVSELGMPLHGYKLGEGLTLGVGPWHKVRVRVQGQEFRLWVDDRPGPTWHEPDYQGGRIGFETWSYHYRGAVFQNVRVRGTEIDVEPWDSTIKPAQNWRIPYRGDGKQQFSGGAARAPNGDLLYFCGGSTRSTVNRSTDNGKTWTAGHPEGWNAGFLCKTLGGRLASPNFDPTTRRVSMSFSDDSGHSWSPYVESNQIGEAPGMSGNFSVSINPFIEVADGTWLLFLLVGHESASGNVLQWGATHCLATVVRSTDHGKTWSDPIALDGFPAVGLNLDLTEPYATRLKDGRVLCLIRPIYSPWMWETWSSDGGATWSPTTRAPLTSYACAMLPHATASGYLVIGGRFPGNAVHISRDQGLTWETYRIGTDTLAGGSMAEIAPDVVLWVYSDSWHSSMRAQAVRITPTGIEPAPQYLPDR